VAQSIGERIKALRAERKLTLAELADRAGVSTSYLSQVERDKTTPSLATLTAMAAALDVQVRYFFETTAEAAFVTRSDDQVRSGEAVPPGNLAAVGVEPETISHQQLAPPGRPRLVVHRLQIPPGRGSGDLPAAACEEFLFVLSGLMYIDVGGESYSLSAGDSLHYDAAQPHGWRNDSDEVCTVIWGSAGGPPEL
jgi:transcriptional regulator with XRE-family HTH domain